MTLLRKASRSPASVTRKQTSTTYISVRLSYFVKLANKSSTPLGKNILCSLLWAKRRDTRNVPEDSSSKSGTMLHASKKTTLTPNART